MIRRPSLSHILLGACCLISAAWLLSACRKPAEFVYTDEEGENATEVVVTDENGQASVLPEGSVLGVYVVEGDGTVVFQKVAVDASGTALLPAIGGGTVIAYSPYQEAWGEDAFLSHPVFTVQNRQSSKENYRNSDLMMGLSAPATRADGPGMIFQHMLARIVVNIIDDIGTANLSQTETTLLDAYTSVTVDLPHQTVSTVEIKRGNVRMLANTATDWRLTCQAIVAPHAMEEGTPFFSIQLFGDKPQTFPLPKDVQLTGGATFTFNLRLTEQGLIPDGWFITNWDSQEENDLFVQG